MAVWCRGGDKKRERVSLHAAAVVWELLCTQHFGACGLRGDGATRAINEVCSILTGWLATSSAVEAVSVSEVKAVGEDGATPVGALDRISLFNNFRYLL
jgi:hypothetical protein